MSWTPEHAKRAALEGWALTETIDNGTSHAYLMVTSRRSHFKDDTAAGVHVVRLARGNSAFHQQALRAVMQSRVQEPIKPRKKA